MYISKFPIVSMQRLISLQRYVLSRNAKSLLHPRHFPCVQTFITYVQKASFLHTEDVTSRELRVVRHEFFDLL